MSDKATADPYTESGKTSAPGRDRLVGILLLVIVVVGYGVPLAKGYLTAREAEQSPEKMEEVLVAALDAEPGSVPSRAWMGRIVMLLPPERAKAVLIDRAENDHRQGVRYVALDWLARYYRAEQSGWDDIADEFLGDPSHNLLYRNLLLLAHPWLDEEGSAQALVDEQVKLLPHPENTVLRPLISDPQLDQNRPD